MSHPYHSRSTPYSSAIPTHVAAFRRVMASHFGYTRHEVVRDRGRCPGSRHCVSEAIDFYTTDLRPQGNGRRLFDFCVRHGHTLDIQAVIFNRRVVGFGRWEERAYTGSHPHMDHVHMEFNDRARTHVTEAKIKALLSGGAAPPPPSEEEDWLMAVTEAEWNALKAKVDRVEKLIGDLHGSTFQEKGVIYRAIDKILKATFGPSEGADADGVVDAFARRLKGE